MAMQRLWQSGIRMLTALREMQPDNHLGRIRHEDIAQHLQLSRERVSKICCELTARGFLSKRKKGGATMHGRVVLTDAGRNVDLTNLTHTPRPPKQTGSPKPNPRTTIRERFWRFFRMNRMCTLSDAFGTILEPGQSVRHASSTLTMYLVELEKMDIVAMRNGDGDKDYAERTWIMKKFSDAPPDVREVPTK